ncbi:RNA polymerase sigma factor [Sorangium cellulosum]|uniref:RNA polymerase sigma factor n=1 Tax=Sorangium cellulosum TaxID=56 RepID=UPI0011DCB5B9|nr:sigma-70 family RNA polymerase sigma factor [Sorangium cellulosum]
MTDSYQTLVAQALKGNRDAARTLVKDLEPVIHARVARVLLWRGAGHVHYLREEVRDLVQHVFAHLFANEGHALREWSPAGGASLHNFVGKIAENEAMSQLRSRRRSPWQVEQPTVPEDFDKEVMDADGPEEVSASREMVVRLLAAVRADFNQEALEIFQLLIVEERPVDEVCALTGKSRDAVYKARSRVVERASELAKKILSDHKPCRRVGKEISLNPAEHEERR